MYLLDSHVIGEFRKALYVIRSEMEFMAIASARNDQRYLSAINIAELQMGAEYDLYLGDARQANMLKDSLNEITDDYTDLILPIDHKIALIWAALQ